MKFRPLNHPIVVLALVLLALSAAATAIGMPIGRITHHPAVDFEAERFQRAFEDVEDLAGRRGHARTADELAREVHRVD